MPLHHSTKPILKWLGGKTQILDKLIPEFPSTMNNYHEIFIGGGSVLLSLLNSVNEGIITIDKSIYAYDANEALISVYKNVQSNPNELYEIINSLIIGMNNCLDTEIIRNPKTDEEGNTSQESFYYWIRNQYNVLTRDEKNSIKGSSLFIFLNKTCFRGIFRLNSSGKFNVPYGNYKKPEIVNRTHLLEVSLLIKNVIFECCDFSISLMRIKNDDFVYMDPPYAPENDKSFVAYTQNGFGKDKHDELFRMIKTLKEKKVKMIMSNADVEMVQQNFPRTDFEIINILCKRSINSKNPESKTKEVIIKNYKILP